MPVPVLKADGLKFLAVFQHWLNLAVPLIPDLVIGIGIVIVLTFVVKLLVLYRSLKTPTTILKLTPPAATDVSAVTTTELFHLIHGLNDHRSWLDRFLFRAPSYSFELVSRKTYGIQYLLRVPTNHAMTVEKTLRGYLPGLKIESTTDYLPERSTAKLQVIQFGLRQPFAYPLKHQSDLATHDPIAYLTNGMTQLAPTELMALQLVLRPVGGLADWSLARNIHHIQWQLHHNLLIHPAEQLNFSIFQKFGTIFASILLGIFGIFTRLFDDLLDAKAAAEARAQELKQVEPLPSASEQELTEQIAAKVEQPLFVCAVHALVLTEPKQRRARVQGLIASFASFTSSDRQALTARWSPLSRLKRWRFKKRLLSNTGLILAPTEIAGLYHFPVSDKSHTEDLVRSKSPELPAPLSFKQTAPQFDNVFATNTYAGQETAIGLTLNERRRHTYILGATGSGKTTLLSTMIYQDILNGKGVAVVDPHGQLVEQLLRVIPDERIKDVVWFAPDDDGFPIALNLLDLPKDCGTVTSSQLQKQKSLVASSLISIFKKFYDEKYFGPRMEQLLRNTILTALEMPHPTLVTLLDILTKKDFRNVVVQTLPEGVLKDYWVNEFNTLGSLQRNQVISPITNKIGGILSSPINYAILSQAESKLDFGTVMNEGKILLCDLSKGKIGEDESVFFGSLVMAKLQLAALNRARIPEADRKDFFLYVDEFQNFATTAISGLVSEARKYRLATILAHQSISQIEDRDIIKNILANVGTTISFRTANPEDEQSVLPIFAPQVSKYEIANLPLYTCYMKVAVGEPQDAFKAMVNNFTAEGSDEIAQAVMNASRVQFATPINLHSEAQQATYQTANLHTNYVAPSGSSVEELFPLSLTGTEYGGDWQTSKSHIETKHSILTKKHYNILILLYRFRFLNRSQLQHFLKLKDPTNLNAWLLFLTQNNYLARNTTIQISGKQPAIYGIATNGIQALKTAPKIDTADLRKLYREHERSMSFIQRCLLLADINLDLDQQTQESIQFGMYLPSDYPALSLNQALAKLAPQSVIVRQKDEQTDLSFVEALSELPDKRLKSQLNRYIQSFNNGEWQAAQLPFPALLLVAATPKVAKTAQRFVQQLTRKLEGSKPKVLITLSNKVIQHGITGDIWKTLSE